MRAENNHKAVPARKAKTKTRTRILKWVLALLGIFILLVVFLVPVFVSSETGRKIILAKINDSIDGKVDFGSLSLSWWKGVKVTDFSFNDSSGCTFVEVKQIATKPHYGSILMGSLSFGETIIDIQINDETTKTLLMYLNPVFANAVDVSGVANFNCERLAIPLAGADRDDLEVTGTVSVKKLRLQASDLLGQILSFVSASAGGEDITIHPTRFVLRNGFLSYDDMQMDIGDNPVNFSGVIGLDKSLNMTVTLPYTLKGRTARVGEEKAGKRITLPLKGTIDKPELDLGKLLEEQVQVIEKGLELLEKLLK